MASRSMSELKDFLQSLQNLALDKTIRFTGFSVEGAGHIPIQSMKHITLANILDTARDMWNHKGIIFRLKGEENSTDENPSSFEIIYKKNGIVLCEYFSATDKLEEYIGKLINPISYNGLSLQPL